MFVSITRLRLRSWLLLPAFFMDANGSAKQAAQFPGFRAGKTLFDRKLVFWTLTAWDSEGAMRSYRSTGVHRGAMPKLAKWCGESQTAHYTTEETTLPSWAEAHAELMARGHIYKVDRPSGTQTMDAIPAPSTEAWRTRDIA